MLKIQNSKNFIVIAPISLTSFLPLYLCVVVCLPMAELAYLTLFTVLSGALKTQSARQTP
jgi:hypothetical protein